MNEHHHDLELDERIRLANQLTPEASERVLDLWPSINAALIEERPVIAPRRRASRRRVLLIAVVVALVVTLVTAAVGGPLRHIFWDAENEPASGQATDPGVAASQLSAGRFARASTDRTDRTVITDIIDRTDPDQVPRLDPGGSVRVVEAPGIDRRLVYIESTNGGFCFQMQRGQVAVAGCVDDFGSNGVLATPGAFPSGRVLEGFVASDVTKLQMVLRSGEVEDVPIERGLFTWREGTRAASRRAVGFVATRAGVLIHEPFTIERHDPNASTTP